MFDVAGRVEHAVVYEQGRAGQISCAVLLRKVRISLCNGEMQAKTTGHSVGAREPAIAISCVGAVKFSHTLGLQSFLGISMR